MLLQFPSGYPHSTMGCPGSLAVQGEYLSLVHLVPLFKPVRQLVHNRLEKLCILGDTVHALELRHLLVLPLPDCIQVTEGKRLGCELVSLLVWETAAIQEGVLALDLLD